MIVEDLCVSHFWVTILLYSKFLILLSTTHNLISVYILWLCIWCLDFPCIGNVRDQGLIPALGRSPGREYGNPLSVLPWRIRMDRAAWWATVHGVAKSRMWLSNKAQHIKCLLHGHIVYIDYISTHGFKKNFLNLFSSVQFSRSVVSDSLRPHWPQHARSPCPSPTPGVHPNPCPLSRWCHPTISSSVIPFSSCPQSFPVSGSFQMSQLFESVGQRIGVSASTSVLAMNNQDWSPLGRTGWISLQSKGLWRVFSNITVQKHQFFSAQLSL